MDYYDMKPETLEYVILTAPGAILRDLPRNCIIAVRVIPKYPSKIVTLDKTFDIETIHMSSGESEPASSHRSFWPWMSILLALSSWAVAVWLWMKMRRSQYMEYAVQSE